MCSKNYIWSHFFSNQVKIDLHNLRVMEKSISSGVFFFIIKMFLSNSWISWRCYLDLIIFKAVIFERSQVSREFSIRYAWLKIMSAFNRVIFYLDLRLNVCINVWEKNSFCNKKYTKTMQINFKRSTNF